MAGLVDPALAVAVAFAMGVSIAFGVGLPGHLAGQEPGRIAHLVGWMISGLAVYIGWSRGRIQQTRATLAAWSWVLPMMGALLLDSDVMAIPMTGAFAALLVTLRNPRPEAYLPLPERRRRHFTA